jgi:hypothetical protein
MKFTINVPEAKLDQVVAALADFGIELEEPAAKKGGKAQHRWKKAISDKRFTVKHAGVTGTVIWQKSTEMRLLAGATILPDDAAPLREDGTPGLAATFTKSLRDAHHDAIDHKNWVTTKDVVLRSVNEVGHFMYFAGTNSWLHMFDSEGHTIDELTIVT